MQTSTEIQRASENEPTESDGETSAIAVVLDPNARPECFSSTLQEMICIAVLTMGVAQASLAGGVCQVITVVIGDDLKMTQGEISWIGSASALTSGSFLLFFGSTADTFGRRRQLLGAFILFLLSSLAGGFATNPIFLLAFRGLQGLASAAAIPAAVGILGSIYTHPCPRKNKAFAFFSAGNPTGFVFGSIASGIATQILSWRAAFWLLAIIYAIFLVLAWFVVPQDEKGVDLGGWKTLDIWGAGLATVGLIMICAALTLAGNAAEGWSTPYIPVILVLGVLITACFVWWESKCSNPVMPLWIWKNRTFSVLMAIVSFGFMNFTISQFWLSLYFQEIRGLSALMTAVWLIPQAISGLLVNVVAAFALSRVDNRLLLLIGSLAYTTSTVAFALQGANTIYWANSFMGLIITVLGADLMYNVANMYVLSALPKTHQSTAGGVFNTCLQLAQAIGLGISTAVYDAIVGNGPEAETPRVRLRGFSVVFWFATGIAAATILGLPFLKLRRQGEVKDSKTTSTVEKDEEAGVELTLREEEAEDVEVKDVKEESVEKEMA
ncbi:hypothetical protein RUND412_010982 [Rhizina undulata]